MADYQQIDLFNDNYKTIQYLLELVWKLNPTGGYDKDFKPLPNTEYSIDTYRNLLLIVEYKGNDTDTSEKIIDNAIYLEKVKDNLYSIYKIDGKIFGEIDKKNKGHIELVNELMGYMLNGEVFKI